MRKIDNSENFGDAIGDIVLNHFVTIILIAVVVVGTLTGIVACSLISVWIVNLP